MTSTSKRLASAVAAAALTPVLCAATAMAAGRGNNDGLGTIYVESQGLYYQTFKTTDLPPIGRFQPLDPTGSPGGGPSTPYGPGDKDFVGGRWWVDTNLDGQMDAGDTYFSCPLLGPGQPHP
jgi:hypothetical protein